MLRTSYTVQAGWLYRLGSPIVTRLPASRSPLQPLIASYQSLTFVTLCRRGGIAAPYYYLSAVRFRIPTPPLNAAHSLHLSTSSAASGSDRRGSRGSELWARLLAVSRVVVPVPVPSAPSSLRVSSRLLRSAAELAVLCGCLTVAVLGVPSLLWFVQSDVLLSQCVLLSTLALYGSAAFLLSRRYPLPPAVLSSPCLSLPAGVAFGLLLCCALTVLLPLLGSSTREDPLILQLCFSAAQHPFVLLDLAILGPLREELLFRGLLFGRLCRLLSPLPAYAASSGVFGLLHSSPDSVKVVECFASGVVLALSYRLTLTLLAPLAIHIINNTLVACLTAGLSPLCEPSTVERSIRLACSIEDAMGSVVYICRTAMGAAEDKSGWHWQTGKQEARAACNDLFTALDRGGKGYLDAEEVGFFFTLDEPVLDMLSAAFTVLQEHCSATTAQPLLSSAWSTSTSLPLPSRSFFGSLSTAQESAITSLYTSLTSPPLAPVDPTSPASLVPPPSVLLTRLSRSLDSSPAGSTVALHHLHTRMCAYYALCVSVMCEQRLGVTHAVRLSRDQFIEACLHDLVVQPLRLKRMVQQAALCAMGAQKHPLAFGSIAVR